jgi:glycerol uptake facilitator-like aquaporin
MNSMFSRRKIAALVAEFLGTGVLAFVVLTVSRSQIGIPYFVAIAAGVAVVMFGLALNRDVILNPAYTLALWTGRRISTVKAILFIAVQILAGFAAFELYKYFSKTPVQALPSAFDSRVLVAEAFGTFVFAFIAVGALYQRAHWLVRSVVTGGAYTLGVMVASVAAAGFINPAVALSANAWAWSTYVAGPVLGAIIGVNLFSLLFADRVKDGAASTVTAVSSSSSRSSTALAHVDEDHKAVKADRLEKVEKAEKEAKKDKSKKKK